MVWLGGWVVCWVVRWGMLGVVPGVVFGWVGWLGQVVRSGGWVRWFGWVVWLGGSVGWWGWRGREGSRGWVGCWVVGLCVRWFGRSGVGCCVGCWVLCWVVGLGSLLSPLGCPPPPSSFGGGLLLSPLEAVHTPPPLVWAFAPSSPSAGGSPPPPSPVGSQPLSPSVEVRPPSPRAVAPPRLGWVLGWVGVAWFGGSVVQCCVVRRWFGWLAGWARFDGECRGVRRFRVCKK